MKKLFAILLTFLIVSCSSVQKVETINEIKKENLNRFNIEIRENLLKNNFEFLEKNIVKTYKNKKILSLLKKIDFTKFNIFISKPVISNKISSTLGLNFGDRTEYIKIYFTEQNNKWMVYDIEI